jgi:hypothetical protein
LHAIRQMMAGFDAGERAEQAAAQTQPGAQCGDARLDLFGEDWLGAGGGDRDIRGSPIESRPLHLRGISPGDAGACFWPDLERMHVRCAARHRPGLNDVAVVQQ